MCLLFLIFNFSILFFIGAQKINVPVLKGFKLILINFVI